MMKTNGKAQTSYSIHSEYQNWIEEAQKEGKVPHEKKWTERIAGGMVRALRATPNGIITQVLHEHSVKNQGSRHERLR